jgi:hypothetical protein
VKPLFVGTARLEPYLGARSEVDWRKSDAFYFGLEPFDHPVWLCERGYGASRTPAARYCSSQSGHDRLRPRFGFCLRATGPPIYYRSAPYNDYNEPCCSASQGYAPGEKEQFLDSVRQGG